MFWQEKWYQVLSEHIMQIEHSQEMRKSDTASKQNFHLVAQCWKLSVILCGSLRPGRLPAAVHQDLWEGESRGGPAAAYHPPGAGGFRSVQNRPPGAHTGGCGLALCSGESKLPTPPSHYSVLSLQRVSDHFCWMKFLWHIWCLLNLSSTFKIHWINPKDVASSSKKIRLFS